MLYAKIKSFKTHLTTYNLTTFSKKSMNNFLKNIRVSWAYSVNDAMPSGVAELAKLMQSEKKEKNVIEMLAMPTSTDAEIKAQKTYKAKNFPVFFPAILSGGTTNDHVSEDAQIIIIDVDGDKNPGLSMEDMFLKLQSRKEVAAIATSIRGGGAYAVVKIKPTRSNDDFHAIAQSLEYELGEIGLNIDPSCKNIARKRFFGYSKRVWFNESEPEMYLPLFKVPARKTAKKALQITPIAKEAIKEVQVSDYRPLTDLIKELEDKKIDITGSYEVGGKEIPAHTNWTAICFAIVNAYGEDGRNLFHRLSQFNSDYAYSEADEKYTHQLATSKGEHTLQTVYGAIKRAGIVVEDFKKIEKKNAALQNYSSPKPATMQRRVYDYPAEWDQPVKKDAIYTHYRTVNALDNLEHAILKGNNDKVLEWCEVLEDIGVPTIPVTLFTEHAPTAYKILTA